MREILFKAKRIDNGKWAEGCLVIDHSRSSLFEYRIRCDGEDDISNMLPACRSCNHYKSALKPEEFRKYLSGIPKRLMRDSIPFQVGERFGIVRIVTDDVTFYYEKIKNKNRNRED